MALAEVAQLIVDLRLKDGLTAGAKKAQASVAGLQASATKATGALNKVQTGVTNLGTAAGRVRGNLGRLAGPLGFGALSLGALGVAAGIKSAVDQAVEFGAASADLARLTGLSVEQTTRLVDALDDFGIDGQAQIKLFGLLEKNVGNYAATADKARKFQEQFGFSLTTANGEIADANELLLRSADYFNSSASASQKATVLAKLYGRNWQQLIPVLSLKRAGILAEQEQSISLTQEQISDLAKLRVAQRNLGDAMGKLAIVVGTALAPALVKAADGLREFVTQNREGIAGLFRGAGELAGQIIDGVKALAPLGKAVGEAWNAIPPDVRKLLIAGLVGNKVLKMTLGIDLLDVGRKAVTDAIGAGVRNMFGRGSSPANPLYVAGAGIGGAGGVGGVVGRTGGLAGKLVSAVSIVAIAGSAFEVFNTWRQQNDQNSQAATDAQENSVTWLAKQPRREDLVSGLAAVETGLRDIRSNPLHVLVQGDAISKLEAMRASIAAQLAKLDAIHSAIGGLGSLGNTYINYDPSQRPRPLPPILPGGGRRTRSPVVSTPAVGIEKNRGRNVSVNVFTSTDHRQNSQAAAVQTRYGGTPATTGAS